MSSPVSRSLELLRSEGYVSAVVERSIPSRPHPIKVDLFGVADIEALGELETLYVQVCRDADLSAHFATCIDEPRMIRLLACSSRRFEVWSWAKKGNRWRERRYRAHVTRSGITFSENAA